MMDKLQEIILGYQEAVLFTRTARRLGLQQTPGKAAVCIGVRRSGKSTYLHQIVSGLPPFGFSPRLHAIIELIHESQAPEMAAV